MNHRTLDRGLGRLDRLAIFLERLVVGLGFERLEPFVQVAAHKRPGAGKAAKADDHQAR